MMGGIEAKCSVPYASSCTHFLGSFSILLSKHNSYFTSTNN